MMHDMQYNDILDILYTKSNKQTMTWLVTITKLKLSPQYPSGVATVRDRVPGPLIGCRAKPT